MLPPLANYKVYLKKIYKDQLGATLYFLENEEVKRTTLRELKVLRMLKQENIVELKYVVKVFLLNVNFFLEKIFNTVFQIVKVVFCQNQNIEF